MGPSLREVQIISGHYICRPFPKYKNRLMFLWGFLRGRQDITFNTARTFPKTILET